MTTNSTQEQALEKFKTIPLAKFKKYDPYPWLPSDPGTLMKQEIVFQITNGPFYPIQKKGDFYTPPTHGEVTIATEEYQNAKRMLESHPIYGHRPMYVEMYRLTGNPIFMMNLFVATESGDVGGIAWNSNRIIRLLFENEYPTHNGELSIDKFSYLVGASSFGVITPVDGKYIVPTEKVLRIADHAAWIRQDWTNPTINELVPASPPGTLVAIDECVTNPKENPNLKIRPLLKKIIPKEDSCKLETYETRTLGVNILVVATLLQQAWLNGSDIFEWSKELKQQGVKIHYKKIRNIYVIFANNKKVIEGAYTIDMITWSIMQRAMRNLKLNPILGNLARGRQKFIEDHKQEIQEITKDFPELLTYVK
jgi:hypothetical protein